MRYEAWSEHSRRHYDRYCLTSRMTALAKSFSRPREILRNRLPGASVLIAKWSFRTSIFDFSDGRVDDYFGVANNHHQTIADPMINIMLMRANQRAFCPSFNVAVASRRLIPTCSGAATLKARVPIDEAAPSCCLSALPESSSQSTPAISR